MKAVVIAWERTRVKPVKTVLEPAMEPAVEEEDAEPEVAMGPDPMVTMEPVAKPDVDTPSGPGGTGHRHEQPQRQTEAEKQGARQR